MPREAFPGYDEPVNLEGDPEELLKTLLDDPEEDQAEKHEKLCGRASSP